MKTFKTVRSVAIYLALNFLFLIVLTLFSTGLAKKINKVQWKHFEMRWLFELWEYYVVILICLFFILVIPFLITLYSFRTTQNRYATIISLVITILFVVINGLGIILYTPNGNLQQPIYGILSTLSLGVMCFIMFGDLRGKQA